MKAVVAGLAAVALCAGMAVQCLAQDAGKPPAGGVPPPRGGPPELSFEKMDANGDGKVTFEEYQAAMTEMMKARFKSMDKDGDGALSKEELQKGRDFRGPRRGDGERGPRPEGDKPGAAPVEAK
jgi:hypothetical protein